jgi:hypothetical protein
VETETGERESVSGHSQGKYLSCSHLNQSFIKEPIRMDFWLKGDWKAESNNTVAQLLGYSTFSAPGSLWSMLIKK